MSVTKNAAKLKKRRSGKKLGKISFEEEIIPKNLAQQLHKSLSNKHPIQKQVQKANEKVVPRELPAQNTEQNQAETKKRKRKHTVKEHKVNTDVEPIENSEQPDQKPELNPTCSVAEKEESKRAKKRKKHAALMLAKKLKVDLAMQEKCLNYLSRWKHNRSDWKFEKLRQVWLQQNMFDCAKIPDQFWETLLEYFSSAKGQIRKTIVDDALKLVEEAQKEAVQSKDAEEEESCDESFMNSNFNKTERARSILQCLQE